MKTIHRILVASIVTIPLASVADLGRYYAVKPVGWTTEIKEGTYCFFTPEGRELVGTVVDMSEEMETGHFPKVAQVPTSASLVNGKPHFEYGVPSHYIIDTRAVTTEKPRRMKSGGTVRFSTEYKKPEPRDEKES